MSWPSSLWHRIRVLVNRRAAEAEMAEEMAFHLAAATEAGMREGLTREEAERRARREFGGMNRFKEEVRDERGVTLIEETASDVRAALRQMRHHPVVAGVIILTLAISIGFNTAVFTVVNAVVLGQLPYPDADRLVVAWSDSKSYSLAPAMSAPDYFDYRNQTKMLEGVAAVWGNRGGLNAPSGAPEYVRWGSVSANFFDLLRVTPAIGRSFTPEYDIPEGPREALLSHGLWRRRFGGDTGVVGTTVELDGEPVTVSGSSPGASVSGPRRRRCSGLHRWTPGPISATGRNRSLGDSGISSPSVVCGRTSPWRRPMPKRRR